MLVQIEAICDVVGNASELGDCGMLTTETELEMGN